MQTRRRQATQPQDPGPNPRAQSLRAAYGDLPANPVVYAPESG
ncbi:hypothetical protein IM53_008380 [Xanthomonas phaseoli pv. dieffenbachiae]|uniref:Uncharacterized protein n=1 Tax=Xanthomonas phaseoli pv. dieffenbachiae TaxID=92828 RepID=A0A1V9HCQ6_9XANT|nr:hypothetical protein IM53_008380 [Xanthomonas phaseoli pv. dieffenbachiae]